MHLARNTNTCLSFKKKNVSKSDQINPFGKCRMFTSVFRTQSNTREKAFCENS